MIRMHNLITGYYGRGIGPSITGYITKGTVLAVTGSNGMGKSTFLKTLAGLLPPASGKIEFEKIDKPKIISYLPQQRRNMDYYFPITVFDVVSMGCWPRINFFKKINSYQKYLVWQALEEVNLLDLYCQNISTLSGGQLQRMLFARMLVQQASFILLDEPFQGIDLETCEILVRSVNKLCQIGCTIVMVLHEKQHISSCFINNILLLTKSSSVWKTF